MELAKRKSPRATWMDYNEGEYFVTVCTQGHKHFFGNIHQGKMLLSEIGKHLVACIENTPHHQPHIRIVQYVVMPNHFSCHNQSGTTTGHVMPCPYKSRPFGTENKNTKTSIIIGLYRYIKIIRNQICKRKQHTICMATTIP